MSTTARMTATAKSSVSSFSCTAAFHALVLHHMLGGIDELNAAIGLATQHPSHPVQNILSLLAPYLRRCVAAAVLGGHIEGTARQQLLHGKQPFVGGAILLTGQCFLLWCLITSVLDPDFMPSVWTFFALMGVALVWTTYVHIEEFVAQYSSRGEGKILLSEDKDYFELCDEAEAQKTCIPESGKVQLDS